MAIQNDDAQRVLASLPLQMLVYFNMWFVALYFVASLLLFIYKGFTFPYPESALAWEVTMLFLYAFVEAARLFLGKHPSLDRATTCRPPSAGAIAPPLRMRLLPAAPLAAHCYSCQ
jgi:hypothetical protein